MNFVETDRDVVTIPTLPDTNTWFNIDLDNPPAIGPTVRTRQIVLHPGVFHGKQVMRAYDRETDTLYVRYKP